MEEEEFEETRGNNDYFVASARLGLSFEKRLERLNQSDRIDQLYGCLYYTGFEERIVYNHREKDLQPIVKRNVEREKKQQSRPKLSVLTRVGTANPRSSDLIVNDLSNANLAEKRTARIIELRQFYVPYHIRVSINLKINIGLWYGVNDQSSSGSQNQLALKPDLIEQPESIVLAYDIECTQISNSCIRLGKHIHIKKLKRLLLYS